MPLIPAPTMHIGSVGRFSFVVECNPIKNIVTESEHFGENVLVYPRSAMQKIK